jgi:hypothetical protein
MANVKQMQVVYSIAGDSLGFVLTEKGSDSFPIVMVAIGTDGHGETYPGHVQVISPEVAPEDIHFNAKAIAEKVNATFDKIDITQEQTMAEIGEFLAENITVEF